jgi:hypothetical protein
MSPSGTLDLLYEKMLSHRSFCSSLCDTLYECRYSHSFEEHHPYGEGNAIERLWECITPSAKHCPRLLDLLTEMTNEMEI